MKRMGLNRVVDDIDRSQYSYEEICCIIEAIHEENNKHTGFCVSKEILLREQNIHFHGHVIPSTL